MSYNPRMVALSGAVGGINAKSIANTLLFTNNSNKTFIPTNGVIRCTAANAVTVGPSVSIGTSPGASDIFLNANILALLTAGQLFGFVLNGVVASIPSGGSAYLNLTTAATGTSQTIEADLVGYYV